MVKKTNWLLIVGILIVGYILISGNTNFFKGAVTGTETMTRTGPAMGTALPSSTFQLTYTAIGTSGSWGASVQDSVSGGCTFPSGASTYKTVMLSEDGLTKTITITTPSSGSCTFTGDYKYGTFPIQNFAGLTITMCTPVCTRPADLCVQSTAVSDGCNAYCGGSWTVVKLVSVDVDCDNHISRTELGDGITQWTSGTFGRDDLGIAIMDWSSGG